ncbi:MAG: hypothetical protein DRO13_05985, partial [Thermoprotei archaeon]
MEFLLLYPCKTGSPDNVGRWIINHVLLHTDIVKYFDTIYVVLESKLCRPRSSVTKLLETISKKDNIILISSLTEFVKISRGRSKKVLYIPKSPFIAPNRRFLINVLTKLGIS